MSILVTIYIVAALLLAVYAFNAWLLTALYFKHRGELPPDPPFQKREELPSVTVQLPIFNEALVVERFAGCWETTRRKSAGCSLR